MALETETGLMVGAAPWSYQGGELGVLVLHGFTGTPQSMRGVAEALAAGGFTVELPRLRGHGTRVEDMLGLGFPDWVADAEEVAADLLARCRRVGVVGLSMGGTLALWLAARHPEIAAVVAINPLVEPAADSFRAAMTDALAEGVAFAPAIGSDIARPGAVEVAYDATPIAPLLSLMDGAQELMGLLPALSVPVLLFSSRTDHVVDPASGDRLVELAGGPVERVWLEQSYHVATLDEDRELVEEGTVAFLRRVLAAS